MVKSLSWAIHVFCRQGAGFAGRFSYHGTGPANLFSLPVERMACFSAIFCGRFSLENSNQTIPFFVVLADKPDVSPMEQKVPPSKGRVFLKKAGPKVSHRGRPAEILLPARLRSLALLEGALLRGVKLRLFRGLAWAKKIDHGYSFGGGILLKYGYTRRYSRKSECHAIVGSVFGPLVHIKEYADLPN